MTTLIILENNFSRQSKFPVSQISQLCVTPLQRKQEEFSLVGLINSPRTITVCKLERKSVLAIERQTLLSNY